MVLSVRDANRPDWAVEGRDWPHREASRFVEAAGLRWHIQEFGRAEAPTLLLLHGTGAATHSWRGLAPLLAQDCCELRQGHPLDVGDRAPVLDVSFQVHGVLPPEGLVWAVPTPPEQPGLRPRSGQDPPPRHRLFLSLRQWLI